jgi:nitrate/nitrite transporter NarK
MTRKESPSLLLPCAAAAAQAFAFMNHAPLVPLLMRDLDISPTQAGLLSTATFLAGGVFSIPLGGLTDRFGPKRVTGAAMAILVASAIGAGLSSSYAVMLLTRVAAGVSLASVFVAGGRYVNAFWQGERQYLAQGFHGGMIQLGVGASIFLLPLLASSLGWRGALVASALPALLAWLAWEWKASPGARSTAQAPLRSLFGNATIWRLGFAHTSMFGTSIVLGAWIAVYLVHEFALPLGVAGVIGSLGSLIGAAARPAGGVLVAARLIRARAMVHLTLGGIVVALGILAWPARPLALAVVGMALAGVATTLGFASIVSLAARLAPGAPAAALGLIALVATFGVIVGAPLVGALWSASGSFTLPLAVLALLPAAALALSLGLPRE